jgi:hypothetical protein
MTSQAFSYAAFAVRTPPTRFVQPLRLPAARQRIRVGIAPAVNRRCCAQRSESGVSISSSTATSDEDEPFERIEQGIADRATANVSRSTSPPEELSHSGPIQLSTARRHAADSNPVERSYVFWRASEGA